MRLYREVISQAIELARRSSLPGRRSRCSGISWGIVTVVLLMAYGAGFQRAMMYGFRNAFSQGTVVVERRTDEHAGRRRAVGPADQF